VLPAPRSSSRTEAPRRPATTAWWERPGLGYVDGDLRLRGESVAAHARAIGTPLFLYDGSRIRDNVQRLRGALSNAGVRHRIYYAMKANRHGPLLAWLHGLRLGGVAAGSPGEVAFARTAGYLPNEITFSGTSLSNSDLAALRSHEGLILNLDSVHDIVRVGRLAPGRRVGLRINPGLSVGYRQNAVTRYPGGRGAKLGIHRDQFPAALKAMKVAGLVLDGLHISAGTGYLTPQLPLLSKIFDACGWFLDRVPPLRYVNIGGGLGVPLASADSSLDLAKWSGLVARHFGGGGFEVWCEPGDFLVRDAGLLVAEVNTVERKGRTVYVGVNAGFGLHGASATQTRPMMAVACRQPAGSRPKPTAVAGNLNDPADLVPVDIPLPPLGSGDLIAFLNMGGYSASMASQHGLRGSYHERLLLPLEGGATQS
jgi:diaminopimelate decarboxylase